MELIFIGEHFYRESNTIMSSLYDTQGYRKDWGAISSALAAGESVSIRPATDAELCNFERFLRNIKKVQQELQVPQKRKLMLDDYDPRPLALHCRLICWLKNKVRS